MTSRVEGDPFDSAWRGMTGSAPIYTIDLRPLSTVETRQLAEEAGTKKAAALTSEIEKAGGNPLFLEMLIRSSSDTHGATLPGNLRSLVQARIDRLAPADRHAIQAASVIGQQFDLNLLRALIQKNDYEPTALLERSLIRPMGDLFLFAHALERRAIK